MNPITLIAWLQPQLPTEIVCAIAQILRESYMRDHSIRTVQLFRDIRAIRYKADYEICVQNIKELYD
jgi:hypothetical protein